MNGSDTAPVRWRERLLAARDALASLDLFTALVAATTLVQAAVAGGTLACGMTETGLRSGALAVACAFTLTLRRR